MSALSTAIRSGDVDVVRAALARDPREAHRASNLIDAARSGKLAVIALFQAHAPDWNARWRGYRPLHASIQEDLHAGGPAEPAPERVRCLERLLAHGADPELHAAFPPARALLVAAFAGMRPLVDALLEHDVARDAFTEAVLGERVKLAKRVRSDAKLARARDADRETKPPKGVDPEHLGVTLLHAACASRLGRDEAAVARELTEIARLLLDAGADANARVQGFGDEVDVAYFAIASNQRATLELLLDRGADATSALGSAAWRTETELVDLALAHGGDPDRAESNGLPLLNDLVRWGQVEPALRLLARKASPNRRDARGWTALHQAASRGNERMLRALLDAGAKRDARDAEGRTPLDVARAAGKDAIAALLSGTARATPARKTRAKR